MVLVKTESTPLFRVVSKVQRGFFGAEYGRKKAGKKGKTDMSLAELKRHIKDAKGKKLPKKSKKRR